MKYLYPYSTQSQSARNLANRMDILRIRRDNSRFRSGPGKVVINWGCSQLPRQVGDCQVINPTSAVRLCTNKLRFFNHMAAYNLDNPDLMVNIPEFTTDQEVAEGWEEEGAIVVSRGELNGNSGSGIYLSTNSGVMNGMPLYTKYIPKREEYRVHVVRGQVLSIQRKALQQGARNSSPDQFRIRNHENGFIFARNEGAEISDKVSEQALRAVAVIDGLDFGAVDVVWNEYRDEAYILEINTAPGLEGTTLDEYTEALREIA